MRPRKIATGWGFKALRHSEKLENFAVGGINVLQALQESRTQKRKNAKTQERKNAGKQESRHVSKRFENYALRAMLKLNPKRTADDVISGGKILASTLEFGSLRKSS